MKQLAVWLQTGQLPLQLSFTRAPMKSSRPLLHPQSHTSTSAANAAGRWKGLGGIGRLLFMIKRVLVSCAVLLGAAGVACGGSSGAAGPRRRSRRSSPTAILSWTRRIYAGQQHNQTLQVTNKGQQDLVVSSVTLRSRPHPGWTLTNSCTPRSQASDGSLNNTREVQPDGVRHHDLQAHATRPDHQRHAEPSTPTPENSELGISPESTGDRELRPGRRSSLLDVFGRRASLLPAPASPSVPGEIAGRGAAHRCSTLRGEGVRVRRRTRSPPCTGRWSPRTSG